MKFREHKSILGISFEGRHITACVMRDVGNKLDVREIIQATLSLDLLSSDPELMGREIRKHLDDAGIRLNRCVVCVPLKWALTVQTELPDSELSDEDLEGFIAVQAEREFPFALEELSLAVSRYEVPDAPNRATMIALPANHLSTLQKVLKAASLIPVSITVGITSLLPTELINKKDAGIVTVLLSENGIDMQISAGGGVVALRSFEEALETDRDGGKSFNLEMIASQLRITLGQLPQTLRESIKAVQIFGPDAEINTDRDTFTETMDRLGMSVKIGDCDLSSLLAKSDKISRFSPVVYVAAARYLLDAKTRFEFLPPRVSRFKRFARKVSARGVAWLVSAAAIIVLGSGLAIFLQYRYLQRLESEWKRVEPQVNELDTVQNRIQTYRPWFDESIPSLRITQKLAEAFPEAGSVWTKSVEIKGLTQVICSGNAISNSDWLAMYNLLRETPGVEDLKVLQTQGDSPLQFSLSYKWNVRNSDGK